jgi:nickel transport protein
MFRRVLIVIALLPQLALAHGVRVTASMDGEVITGLVTYADGSPIVNASAELSRSDPADARTLLAQSRSNGEGRFAFPAPRTTGEFQITVDDGLGHRGKTSLIVSADTPAPSSADADTSAPITPPAGLQTSSVETNWVRWLSGLGYLLGLFGLVSWWFSRRANKRSKH